MRFFKAKTHGRLIGISIVTALALVFLATGVLGAKELVVYTALEDDEVAIYRKDFEAKHVSK